MILLTVTSIWGLGVTGVVIAIAVSVTRRMVAARPASTQPLGSFLFSNIGSMLACTFGLAASAIFYYGFVVYPFLLAVHYWNNLG